MEKPKRSGSEALAEGYYRFDLPEDANQKEVDRLLALAKERMRKRAGSLETSVRDNVFHWLSQTPTR